MSNFVSADADRKGTSTGVAFGEALTDALRGMDVVARFGGDEFAVMLPRTTQEQAGKPDAARPRR